MELSGWVQVGPEMFLMKKRTSRDTVALDFASRSFSSRIFISHPAFVYLRIQTGFLFPSEIMQRRNLYLDLKAANQTFSTCNTRSLLRLQLPRCRRGVSSQFQNHQQRWYNIKRLSIKKTQIIFRHPLRSELKERNRKGSELHHLWIQPYSNSGKGAGKYKESLSRDGGKYLERIYAPRQFGLRNEDGTPISDGPIYDENIQSSMVTLVSETGSLQDPVTRYSVLQSMDRKENWLKQVQPPANGRPAICKIVPKLQERQAQKAKSKKHKDPNMMMKEIELGWAISAADLEHKMHLMRSFLEQGRRVEITAGQKKGQKIVERKEMEALVATIKKAITDAEATEISPVRGEIGNRLTITAGGRKAKERIATQGVTFSWASGLEGLENPLKLMREALEDGKRVEIEVGGPTKVRGKEEKAVLWKERKEMLERIREGIREAGAVEWRDMHGTVGSEITMFVERRNEEES